jgi:putative transcriptional regulator
MTQRDAEDITRGMDVIGPGLLVASPQLNDPFFSRTVVLLCRHEADGAMGVVINRSTDVRLDAVLEELDLELPADVSKAVMWGGPVEPSRGTLVFRSGLADHTTEAIDVSTEVRISGSLEVLTKLASREKDDWSLYLGYAGWGAGQLDKEITEGSWIVLPLDADTVFQMPLDERYDRCLASLGVDASMLFMMPVDE